MARITTALLGFKPGDKVIIASRTKDKGTLSERWYDGNRWIVVLSNRTGVVLVPEEWLIFDLSEES